MIILYFLENIKIPISNQQLDEFILETNYMSFFEYQQYLTELSNQGLVFRHYEEGRYYLSITEHGEQILSLLNNIIPDLTKKELDEYVKKNFRRIKMNTEVFSDYKKVSQNEYIVQCSIREGNSLLFDLKVNVPEAELAKRICKNWQTNAEEVYKTLFNKLAK
ncbi:DUF4364 family protein [Caldicellulosiruptoraceae bacterium PP1]